jgi:hypothetical protein
LVSRFTPITSEILALASCPYAQIFETALVPTVPGISIKFSTPPSPLSAAQYTKLFHGSPAQT